MTPSSMLLSMKQRARAHIDTGTGGASERHTLVRLMSSACQFLSKAEALEFRKLIDELQADNEKRYPGQEKK